MSGETDDQLLLVIKEIRTWVRVATYQTVRKALEEALPDAKSRAAYQMFDGQVSFDKIRVACKLSPNAVVALTARCLALGLMETNPDKKRVRLFDLRNFGLLDEHGESENGAKSGK